MKMKIKLWTTKEDKLLRKLYPQFQRDDISRGDLEKIFNRTFESICGRAGRVGLRGKKYENINEDYLRELKRQGRIKI